MLGNRHFLEDGVSLKAIALGWFVKEVALGIVLFIFFIFTTTTLVATGTGVEQIAQQAFSSIGYKIVHFGFSFIITILGGYLTARIADKAKLKNALAMGILSLLTGLILQIMSKLAPSLYQIFLLLLDVPCALLGGYLRIITYKPTSEISISEEVRKRIKKKKRLTGTAIALAGIVTLIVIAAFFLFIYIPGLFCKVPTDLEKPAVTKGSATFSKSVFANIFLRDNQLGNITDIVFRKSGRDKELEIGLAGTKGALFLDNKFNITSSVAFGRESQHIDIISTDDTGGHNFLDRKNRHDSSSSLIDSAGKTLWSYGDKLGVDDMAAGDIEGNGSTEFVVGFNGGGGIHLLDANGNKKWEKPDGNVWHVELVDTNGDGKLEIVHSNATYQITTRDIQGNIINQKKVSHHFTEFSITKWPDQKSKEYVLFSENAKIWLIDFNGNDIAQFDAPQSRMYGHARGIPVRIIKNQPEYFAVLVDYKQWERSCLYIYNSSKALVYQEILPDSCAAIAPLPSELGEETLLIGCSGKVWQYNAHN